jgi:hypothetical protein
MSSTLHATVFTIDEAILESELPVGDIICGWQVT